MSTTSKLGKGTLNYFFEKQRERTAVSSNLSNNQDINGLNKSSKDQGDGNIIAVSTRTSVLGLGLVNKRNEKNQTKHNNTLSFSEIGEGDALSQNVTLQVAKSLFNTPFMPPFMPALLPPPPKQKVVSRSLFLIKRL